MVVAESKEIDFFVASKIGSFKHIKYHTDVSKNNKKYIENLVDIKSLQKDDAITSMVWGNAEQTEILIGRKNQQIQTYNTLQGFTKTYTADFGTGDIIGIGKYKRRLIAGLSSGVVQVWSKKDNFILNTGAKLDKMKVFDGDSTIFATGGEENELKVWKIGESSPIFTAKNLPHDWLQLRKPVWVSDLTFLSEEIIAICSRYGYVRLYDTRAQRRPVCNVEFDKMAATCIVPGLEERQVFVGFGRGQLHQVDLRRGKPDKGYKGSVGSVTSISVVKSAGLVVSTSLDRHLRVYGVQSKEMVYKQYLTSKLASVLVQTESSTPLQNLIKEEDQDLEKEVKEEDMDEIFDNMETVGDKSLRKRSEAPESETIEIEANESEAKKSKPSTEGSTIEIEDEEAKEEAIRKLLRSTEKQKKRMDKRKREKKAKSIFHNA